MEHKPQPRPDRLGFVCRECGKGVSRRRLSGGRRVWVHHNPTGLLRYNRQGR